MFRIFILLVSFVCSVGLQAQHDHFHPCGTAPVKSNWLKKYQLNPEKYKSSRNDVIYVPIAVTLVGKSDYTGFFAASDLQEALCRLNEDFVQSNLHFYLGTDIRYLASSKYANHESVLDGATMMEEHNVPDMINCYFMQTAAGNCGYNLPYAGMCVAHGCAGADDHTWAHEMGHQLSLPHPFLGWEGGVSHDGSVSHSFDDPAPEIVTYDYTYFRDTLIRDTMIIDTAYVEKMDGSNCAFAADGFCDTKPDYLASRWPCDNDNLSTTEQTDPDGVKFISDGKWIMSYASDVCSSEFSDEQIAAMRANLTDEKPYLLGNENPQMPVEASALEGAYPVELEQVYPENIEIGWTPIEGATQYVLQLRILSANGIVVLDSFVNQPPVVISSLDFPSRDHYWSITAFNDYEYCTTTSLGGGSFEPNESVGVEDLKNNWKIYPTYLQSAQLLNIEGVDGTEVNVKVYSSSGELVTQHFVNGSGVIDVADFVSGIYLVQVAEGTKSFTQKIIVQ